METREFYRGFCAKIRFCYTTQIYTGEIDGMTQPVIFQASTYPEAQQSFKTAVEDYLKHGTATFPETEMDVTEEPIIEKLAAYGGAAVAAVAAAVPNIDAFRRGKRFDG